MFQGLLRFHLFQLPSLLYHASRYRLEYFYNLSNYFKAVLGKKVDVFNMTNSFFQNDNTIKTQLDNPMYLKHEDLQEILLSSKEMDPKIDCLYEQDRIDNMIKELIDSFT